MEWKIYYADGSAFSSEDGSPQDAPGWGVQVIAVRDPAANGRCLLQGYAYYWMAEYGQFCGGDLAGLHDNFINLNASALKAGRSIESGLFKTIFDAAKTDPETMVWLR